MKTVVVAALLASAGASAATTTSAAEAQFAEFKQTYNKKYESAAEEERRFAVFSANMKRAAALSRANPLATFGPGVFADMSPAEFKPYHNGEKLFAARVKETGRPVAQVGEQKCRKIDWREKGAVTHVKNQGQCGSCWAFSTTGNIEGQWKLASKEHKLTPLSEQELVSCDTVDNGCNGGLMDNAFKWLLDKHHGKIVTEAAFSYTSGTGFAPPCPRDIDSRAVGAVITGYHDLPHVEDKIASWMCEGGPVAIAVDATSWQTYMGGIMTNCISSQIDHGVLAVGFDDTYHTPYWIIKNSWGPSWGEKGYIRVQKGTNQCLITSYPTSSVASKGPLPPPGPTHPPGPTPSPTPSPSSGSLIQMNCLDSACSSLCSNNTFPLNQCLPLSGGGSAIATCSSTVVTLNEYYTNDCTGTATPDQMPLNQCLQSTTGGYFENFCVSSAVQARRPMLQRIKRTA